MKFLALRALARAAGTCCLILALALALRYGAGETAAASGAEAALGMAWAAAGSVAADVGGAALSASGAGESGVLSDVDGVADGSGASVGNASSAVVSSVGGAAVDYLGVLEIPVLGLELPVASSLSYPVLKLTPCRYSGSLGGGLVVAGHSYRRHFGRLGELGIGDLVWLSSGGETRGYSLALVETLDAYDAAELLSGGWDLTLFTCTPGGAARLVYRFSCVD